MSVNLNDIDNFFKNPIEAYSEMPSEDIWNAVVNNFDKNTHAQLKKKYQNLKKVAAVLLLLLCSSIFFLLSNNNFSKSIAQQNMESAEKNISKKDLKGIKSKNNLDSTIIFSSNTIVTNLPTRVEKINTNENNEQPKLKSNIENNLNKNNKINLAKKEIVNNPKKSNKTLNEKFNLNTTNDGENIVAKNEKQTLSHKTNITIINGNATEDANVFNSNLSNQLLQSSFVKIQKRETIKSVFSPNIISPYLFSYISKIPKINVKLPLKKVYNFSLSIYAAPEVAFNRVEDDKPHQDRSQQGPPNNNRPPDDKRKLRNEENKTTSFSYGVLMDYKINEKILIQSGFGIISKSIETKPKKVFAERNPDGVVKYKNNCALGASYIDPKTGIVVNVGDSTTIGVAKNTVQYLSVPLNFMYAYKLGHFKINPLLGFTANFLVKQNVSTSIEGNSKQDIKNIDGVNASYFNANIGVGVGYALHKKIDIVCTPNVRIALNALNKNSNVKFYPNTVGLMVGLRYNF